MNLIKLKRPIVPILVLFALVGTGMLYAHLKKQAGTVSEKNQEFKTIQENQQKPKLNFENIPESEKVNVSGIEVNNFFKDSETTENLKIAIAHQDNNFNIQYLNELNQFLISITGSPFSVYKTAAENKLLVLLGINKEQACKLNVVITTPRFANPNDAGKEYKLSFCE